MKPRLPDPSRPDRHHISSLLSATKRAFLNRRYDVEDKVLADVLILNPAVG